ncbi:peptidoglycan-binding protein [Ruminococcus sp.]|uniref:peptidoglycan-binding protein n=1 Tax=Ruminococcus sp. TaxID=41978 RepID=UPI003864EE65
MKRIISVLLAAVMVCTAAVIFAGCGDGNYPVTVANITIDKEPEAIVVLDPSAADIISYMNYDGKIVGRSTEVDQSYLSVAPDFGAAAEPDVNSIINSGAQVVFAGDKINDDAVKQLQEKKIQVIKMSLADTPKELETNYLTIGKILGGAVTGLEKGTSSYEKLIEHMEKLKIEVSSSTTSGALETACYLYVDDGSLRVMTSGTYVDMLIGYTGAVNVAVNIIDGNVEVNTLRIANPNYIFYSDEQTLNAIQSDDVLSKLTAVTSGKALQVSEKEITRQGLTALATLEKMIGFMHPELAKKATTDEAATQAQTPAQTATEAATQAATQAAAQATQAANEAPHSEADRYDIKITDDLSLKKGDEDKGDSKDVWELQHRLWNLDYLVGVDNVTGFYGDLTEQAVKDYQKAAGFEVTGVADNKTIKALFMSDAPKGVLPEGVSNEP